VLRPEVLLHGNGSVSMAARLTLQLTTACSHTTSVWPGLCTAQLSHSERLQVVPYLRNGIIGCPLADSLLCRSCARCWNSGLVLSHPLRYCQMLSNGKDSLIYCDRLHGCCVG
jgi:hypothetical protein